MISSNGHYMNEEKSFFKSVHTENSYKSIRRFADKYLNEKHNGITKALNELVLIAQEILHEVELREPRFVNSLKIFNSELNAEMDVEQNDGIRVLSPTDFEVTLYLNQMGVFNFVDDASVPGGAVLKLSDGRKRSMSLWVEFITASGYLSARKLRARFQSLVTQAVEICSYNKILRIIQGTSNEVTVRIRETYSLQLTLAFRCNGIWPRSAAGWPEALPDATVRQWPSQTLINEIKQHDGFDLLSQESIYMRDKQASIEGDAWLMNFHRGEQRLLKNGTRKRVLEILKELIDRVFPLSRDNNEARVLYDYHLTTFVLHECDKHGLEEDWQEYNIIDRINGVLLQIISCLQHRRCPHYFLPNLDLFRGKPRPLLDQTSKVIWQLLRDLIIRPSIIEQF